MSDRERRDQQLGEKSGYSLTCSIASGRKYKNRLYPNDVCIEDKVIESYLRDREVDEEDKCYVSSCKCYDERESVVGAPRQVPVSSQCVVCSTATTVNS